MGAPTTPCPGCAAPMEMDQEVCGACRRPRDEREVQAGYDALHAADAERRRRPRKILAWVLAGAATVLLVRQRAIFAGLARSLAAGFSRRMEEEAAPRSPSPPKTAAAAAVIKIIASAPAAPAPPSAARPVPAQVPAQVPAPTPVTVVMAVPPPSVPPAPPPARPAVEPPPPGAGIVLIYGVVYDLRTALAIPRATILLRSARGWYSSSIETTADGSYSLAIPSVNFRTDYEITARAKGYREGQIEDPLPPYRERTPAQRLEAQAELSPQDLEAVPVRVREPGELYPLDLVLVPDAQKAAP